MSCVAQILLCGKAVYTLLFLVELESDLLRARCVAEILMCGKAQILLCIILLRIIILPCALFLGVVVFAVGVVVCWCSSLVRCPFLLHSNWRSCDLFQVIGDLSYMRIRLPIS